MTGFQYITRGGSDPLHNKKRVKPLSPVPTVEFAAQRSHRGSSAAPVHPILAMLKQHGIDTVEKFEEMLRQAEAGRALLRRNPYALPASGSRPPAQCDPPVVIYERRRQEVQLANMTPAQRRAYHLAQSHQERQQDLTSNKILSTAEIYERLRRDREAR